VSARSKTPTKKGTTPAPTTDERTRVYRGPEVRGTEQIGLEPAPAPVVPSASESGNTFKAISMKSPDGATKTEPEPPVLPAVKLRAMSEFHRAQTPQNLGNLAPPYDPHEARKRTAKEYVMWGSIAVILASGIALVVWFVAR
jgi:hypothetical protein